MKNKLQEFLEKLIKEDINGFATLVDIEDFGIKNIIYQENKDISIQNWNAYDKEIGYVVSIQKDAIAEFKIDLSNVKTWKDVDNETKKQFKNFINNYRTEYGRNIGFWYDKVKKLVILDQVFIERDLKEAKELAIKLENDSIYDLKNEKYIDIN